MLGTIPRKFADWIGWNSPSGRSGGPAVELAASPSSLSSHDVGTAVELFSRLAEITTTVANEVQQHHGNIQSVNDELGSIQQGDASAVAAAVCKLLVMNQQTQQRLAHAELRLQAQQRQLKDVANAAKTDPLTGVANRRGLDEDLANSLAKFAQRGRPTALLMLDIDHFKSFNDQHGHIVGDQALKRLADVLLAQARDSDSIARFGGEEFVVVFHGSKAAAVLERVENMRRAIGQATILASGVELRIAASAGLAELQKGDTAEALLKRADEALYAAKLDGRDCCYWHADDRLQRVSRPSEEPHAATASGNSPDAIEKPSATGTAIAPKHQSVELAADQFADSSFVGQVARRVAEWRRGGATFSVVLLRASFPAGGQPNQLDEARRTALRIVHQFARASLRDMDLLTRWKDDGLAILLPGSLVTDAAGVANRLRLAIEKHDMPAPHDGLKLSLCAGVAEVIEGNDAQRVLRRAWMALDSAAETGGGKVFLHDGLRPAAV
jgi:diguanylate cyclase (GGDEF)-like protein